MTEHPSLGTSERIEGLNDLLEQFADIAQSLEDFQINHKDEILDLPFEHLRTRIGEFQQQTEKHLAQLLLDHAPVKPLPGPSRPAPASRKRVIKPVSKARSLGNCVLRRQTTDPARCKSAHDRQRDCHLS
jgi:hypothetical protein